MGLMQKAYLPRGPHEVLVDALGALLDGLLLLLLQQVCEVDLPVLQQDVHNALADLGNDVQMFRSKCTKEIVVQITFCYFTFC
jgi:hypothetical protein